VAAHLEPEILIVDEVLAVGDAQFQKKCLGKMEDVGREGRTVLFVSHNMAAINRLCNRCAMLDGGKVQVDGPTQHAVGIYLNKGGTLKAKKHFEHMKGAVVQYVSICVTDTDGNPASLVLEDKGFRIRLEVEAFENTPNIYFGLILFDSEGQAVLYADSRDGEYSLPSRLKKGSYKFSLNFPPIFKSAIYTVTLGIASSDTLQQLQLIESACSFEIIQNANMQRRTPRYGLINLNLNWELNESFVGY